MYEPLLKEIAETTLHYLRSANLLEDTLLNKIDSTQVIDGEPLSKLYHYNKQDSTPAELDEFFMEITEALSRAIRPKPVLIPFGHRYPLPTKLFAKSPNIQELCKAFQTPVIYSDQEEAIGVGSINPIAANAVAARVKEELSQTMEAAPYVFVFGLTASSWNKLLERQFVL